MPKQMLRRLFAVTLVLIVGLAEPLTAETLSLNKGDSIAIIGNTLADRMQHHGWLETYIHAAHPKHDLTIRNLGFAGDEIKTRPRSQSFGSPDEWLTKVEADVVLCFFGYNEALRGDAGLAQFETDLGEMIDGMRGNQYNGKSAPRIVVFSPIAHEDLNSHVLPDGSENNAKLGVYTEKMKSVCESKGVPFVDLFSLTKRFYEASSKPLTMNGSHLLGHGNKRLARSIVKTLCDANAPADSDIADLREAVLDKSYHWFSRYRVVDGYNVYGGRSALNWHGQSNKDVMIREMEIFDVMTANRDKRIWAVAKGNKNYKVVDDNLPPELTVKTNKRGDKDDGSYTYLGGKEAIGKMKMASGMKANLFASEEMFPELVNPVQMAVDTDSRLFVSVWPSYPHWNPTEPRTDRIICLPDENADGVADKCVVFADKLNSITGFEFWGGGMLVCAPPEIWFLKDTDGDDKADVKIRMLQGVSSADTHHTANAMVIGPDGGLYWSRGVFHVTNMETPTKTFRSTSSGVYRFDPRTYEIDFHFPIGPNPHGDVFDQWGYQFVNDGTGGTGSYVNIGKGIGNKQWFKKRVRPVAATGMLSSSHFPEANQGNFLICNTIGFLGVLQHEVKYNGADIYAEEIEPILVSSDQNFRPTDLEVGGDGALYVSDWSNALIGHMQHNMRDPNRDHAHGRIYRVTYEGRELLKPWKLKGKPISEVLKAFYAKENGVRYRARLELSGRETDEVTKAVAEFAAKLDPADLADAQAMLESLWVFEEHRVPNHSLVKRIMAGVAEPRVRAAAIRTLGHWGMKVTDWQPTLTAAAQDQSPLVRAEAVKAAVSFEGLEAAEVIFEVANQETDPELDTVINYARGQINVDAVVQDAVASGKRISVAAQKYVLRNASVEDLLKLNRSKAVYEAILERPNATVRNVQEAIAGLALETNKDPVTVLIDTINTFDREERDANYEAFGQALATLNEESLAKLGDELVRLATTAKADELRQAGFAGWIAATKSAKEPFTIASKSKESLRDLLGAVSLIASPELRGDMFDNVQFLTSSLPEHLAREAGSSALAEPGIKVDYFGQNPGSVEREKLARLKPSASGIVPRITIDVPQLGSRDGFALRFTGAITIEKSGSYEFHIASDDGSRLYVGNKELINNDGLHGMSEKSNRIRLTAGTHPFEVTYFDNGGGDGLRVLWSGPGFKRQPIPTDQLSVVGAETIHDVAISTLGLIPGYEAEKFETLSKLIRADQHRTSAVRAMLDIAADSWPEGEVAPLAETLATYVSKIPARYRTGKTALEAMRLTDMLAARLPDDQKRAYQSQLADLAVNVIRIGTVPHRMIYDKERLAIQAGKPVEFIFSNTDSMPHNFAIVKPGALEEVGLAAEATARDADAMARHYIPKSDKILLASRLIQPTETQALSFEAPTEPGIYPYVCTYPGHWRRMYGALYVVADLKAYLADPDKYVAANPLPLRDELLKYNERNTEWAFDDLSPSLMTLAGQGHDHHTAPRDFEVGRSVFKAASCVACHQLNGEGYVFGPDLAKLDPKKANPKHILESLLAPSKVIDENYRSYTFQMESGLTVTGLILKETTDQVHVIVDPIAKPEPTILKKDEIEDRFKSDISTMPKGLANKLTREEILDLIAYVHSGGKMNHKVFAGGHEHHDH